MFDFSSVREVDGKRSAGFEELCALLSEALCAAPVVEPLRVDGAGGDGGVEAVVKTVHWSRYQLPARTGFMSRSAHRWAAWSSTMSEANVLPGHTGQRMPVGTAHWMSRSLTDG